MTELRVMNNPKVASEHEEFIANLNRKVTINNVNNTIALTHQTKYYIITQQMAIHIY